MDKSSYQRSNHQRTAQIAPDRNRSSLKSHSSYKTDYLEPDSTSEISNVNLPQRNHNNSQNHNGQYFQTLSDEDSSTSIPGYSNNSNNHINHINHNNHKQLQRYPSKSTTGSCSDDFNDVNSLVSSSTENFESTNKFEAQKICSEKPATRNSLGRKSISRDINAILTSSQNASACSDEESYPDRSIISSNVATVGHNVGMSHSISHAAHANEQYLATNRSSISSTANLKPKTSTSRTLSQIENLNHTRTPGSTRSSLLKNEFSLDLDPGLASTLVMANSSTPSRKHSINLSGNTAGNRNLTHSNSINHHIDQNVPMQLINQGVDMSPTRKASIKETHLALSELKTQTMTQTQTESGIFTNNSSSPTRRQNSTTIRDLDQRDERDLDLPVPITEYESGSAGRPDLSQTDLLSPAEAQAFININELYTKNFKHKYKHKKGVTFNETTSEVHCNGIMDILNIMLSGTHMVKVRSNVRLYDRYFWLDPESNSLHWEPSKKDIPHVHISTIKEVRWGQMTETFKTADPEGSLVGKNDFRRDYIQESKKCFSIIYSQSKPNLTTKTPSSLDFSILDLMVESVEIAEIWVLGLTLLQSVKLEENPVEKLRQNLIDYENLRTEWLTEVFEAKVLEFKQAAEKISSLTGQSTRALINESILTHDACIAADLAEVDESIENKTKTKQKSSPLSVENNLPLNVTAQLLSEQLYFVSINCARSELVQNTANEHFNPIRDSSSKKAKRTNLKKDKDRQREAFKRESSMDVMLNDNFNYDAQSTAYEESNVGALGGDSAGALKNANVKISPFTKRRNDSNNKVVNDTVNLVSSEAFVESYRNLAERYAFISFAIRYSSSIIKYIDADRPPLTFSPGDLQFFFESEQNVNFIDLEECVDIIQLFEPIRKFRERNLMGLDGFIRMLKCAEFSSLFNPMHGAVPLIFENHDEPSNSNSLRESKAHNNNNSLATFTLEKDFYTNNLYLDTDMDCILKNYTENISPKTITKNQNLNHHTAVTTDTNNSIYKVQKDSQEVKLVNQDSRTILSSTLNSSITDSEFVNNNLCKSRNLEQVSSILNNIRLDAKIDYWGNFVVKNVTYMLCLCVSYITFPYHSSPINPT